MWPSAAAHISAVVFWNVSAAFTSTPRASSRRTAGTLPARAAASSGVSPSGCARVGLAPASQEQIHHRGVADAARVQQRRDAEVVGGIHRRLRGDERARDLDVGAVGGPEQRRGSVARPDVDVGAGLDERADGLESPALTAFVSGPSPLAPATVTNTAAPSRHTAHAFRTRAIKSLLDPPPRKTIMTRVRLSRNFGMRTMRDRPADSTDGTVRVALPTCRRHQRFEQRGGFRERPRRLPDERRARRRPSRDRAPFGRWHPSPADPRRARPGTSRTA